MVKQLQKQAQYNRGFSLVELLISMTIVSIVMLMVVSFMASTSAAYKKVLSNQEVQSEAKHVNSNLEAMLMSANFVRVSSGDGHYYTMKYGEDNTYHAEEVSGKSCPNFDFVPDNYPNYSYKYGNATNEEQDVILNTDFQLITYDGRRFPIADAGYETSADLGSDDSFLFSFRALSYDYDAVDAKFIGRSADDQYYVKPDYLYLEYSVLDPDPSDTRENYLGHIIYGFTWRSLKIDPDVLHWGEALPTTGTIGRDYVCGIYMYRYYTYEEGASVKMLEKDADLESGATGYATPGSYAGFGFAKSQLLASASADNGVVTELLTNDFYIAADADSNAVVMNMVFNGSKGYSYYGNQTVSGRTTYSLSAKPYRLKQYVNGHVEDATYGSGGSGSGGEDEEDGPPGGETQGE